MKPFQAQLLLGILLASRALHGQASSGQGSATVTAEQIRQLALEVNAAEQRLQSSESELAALKARLAALEAALPPVPPSAAISVTPQATPSTTDESTDALAAQTSQISTLHQIKVESSSKFPLRVNGLVLLTTALNSSGVDAPVDATASLGGPGSTALALRQTILGFDADGPHLAGAHSSADLRIDFYGASAAASYPSVGGLLRLRTAHAALDWPHTQLFFSFDRTLLNPNAPASLVQVAAPGLAWSGNLWSWMPQLGVTSKFGQTNRLVLQAALVSPPDAPYPVPATTSSRTEPATLAESSRLPGGEARVSYERGDSLRGVKIGVGGYVSAHTIPGVGSFNSWAATIDLRVPVSRRVDLSGSFYRGAGLGGLGAGGYKDWVSRTQNGMVDLHAPDDLGGWTQLAIHLRGTLDWNSSFGMDNVFAGQLRSYTIGSSGYGSLARNRTVVSNLIWSPRPYLPFSFEYRRLYTAPIIGPLWNTDVFALGAGYRF